MHSSTAEPNLSLNQVSKYKMATNVLIVGATGETGTSITNGLVEAGTFVRLLSGKDSFMHLDSSH